MTFNVLKRQIYPVFLIKSEQNKLSLMKIYEILYFYDSYVNNLYLNCIVSREEIKCVPF